MLDAAAAACCAQRQKRSYFSNRLDNYLTIEMYHFISKPGSYSSSDRGRCSFSPPKTSSSREEMQACRNRKMMMNDEEIKIMKVDEEEEILDPTSTGVDSALNRGLDAKVRAEEERRRGVCFRRKPTRNDERAHQHQPVECQPVG